MQLDSMMVVVVIYFGWYDWVGYFFVICVNDDAIFYCKVNIFLSSSITHPALLYYTLYVFLGSIFFGLKCGESSSKKNGGLFIFIIITNKQKQNIKLLR